jgi:hypothetical protein
LGSTGPPGKLPARDDQWDVSIAVADPDGHFQLVDISIVCGQKQEASSKKIEMADWGAGSDVWGAKKWEWRPEGVDEKLKGVAKRYFDVRPEKTDGLTTNLVCGKEIVWIWPWVVV